MMEGERGCGGGGVCSNSDVKVIEWEEFEQELARFWSLSAALKQANQKKLSLQQSLHALIQVPFNYRILG
jgi:hypothetical protein